jgi:transcriptional regulator with XRE-family HTH domain
MRSHRAERSEHYETPQYKEILARVAANTRRLREAAGWSQEEAAHQCGEMSTRLYQLVEVGLTNITAVTLGRLCQGFGVDAVTLLAPASPRPKRKPGRPRKMLRDSGTGSAAPGLVEKPPETVAPDETQVVDQGPPPSPNDS